jgi:putative transposase
MHARGMSNREIVGHLQELYGVEVLPDLISAVTDAVLEEVAVWAGPRPLDPVYPIVFFDAARAWRSAPRVSFGASHIAPWVRATMANAVPIALGIRADGTKEILGLWLEQSWRGHKTVQWTVLPDNGRLCLERGGNWRAA